ncbi:hypothetical protein BHE74_00030260 [Ensete ventricosum]|nr:hypothetical protein BHE74_00030260 [Ensete ventricosum]
MQIHNICTLSPWKESKWGKILGRECHTPGSVRLLWYAATALSASSRDGQIRKQQPGRITKQNRFPEKTSNYTEKNAKYEANNISNSQGSESEKWGEKEKKGDLRAGKHLGMPWNSAPHDGVASRGPPRGVMTAAFGPIPVRDPYTDVSSSGGSDERAPRT